MHPIRHGAVELGAGQDRKEDDADADPVAADQAGQRRDGAEADQPLARRRARAHHQPDEGGEIEQHGDRPVGGHRLGWRVDDGEHPVQDAAEDDQQHDRRNAVVHRARIAVLHLAEAGVRHVGLEQEAEQQHVEAPAEDPGQHRDRKLVLAGGAGEPQPDGCVADQPDGEDPETVEQREQGEVSQRAQPLLRPRAGRQPGAQPVEQLAQDGFGGDRDDGNEAEQEKERGGSPSAMLAFVEQPGNDRELPAECGNRADVPAGALEEGGEFVRAFRGGWLGRRNDAVGFQFLGHGFGDRIDQGVVLLLRQVGRRRGLRRLGRLGLPGTCGGDKKADRQRECAEGGDEDASLRGGRRS